MLDCGVSREERARLRRSRWSGGRVSSDEHARLDADFWRDATFEERLAAAWEMAQMVWSMENPDGPPLRLDRSVGGVRRREG